MIIYNKQMKPEYCNTLACTCHATKDGASKFTRVTNRRAGSKAEPFEECDWVASPSITLNPPFSWQVTRFFYSKLRPLPPRSTGILHQLSIQTGLFGGVHLKWIFILLIYY